MTDTGLVQARYPSPMRPPSHHHATPKGPLTSDHEDTSGGGCDAPALAVPERHIAGYVSHRGTHGLLTPSTRTIGEKAPPGSAAQSITSPQTQGSPRQSSRFSGHLPPSESSNNKLRYTVCSFSDFESSTRRIVVILVGVAPWTNDCRPLMHYTVY